MERALAAKEIIMEDKNKFAIALEGDNFGPKILFVGDQVRFMPPDSTSSIIGEVIEVPSSSMVRVESKSNKYIGNIFRDRILSVFPKFK